MTNSTFIHRLYQIEDTNQHILVQTILPSYPEHNIDLRDMAMDIEFHKCNMLLSLIEKHYESNHIRFLGQTHKSYKIIGNPIYHSQQNIPIVYQYINEKNFFILGCAIALEDFINSIEQSMIQNADVQHQDHKNLKGNPISICADIFHETEFDLSHIPFGNIYDLRTA